MSEECSARKLRKELRNQSPCRQNTLLTGHHQNIGGAVPAGQSPSYREPQILQKSSLATPGLGSGGPSLTFSPGAVTVPAGQPSSSREPLIFQKSGLTSPGHNSGGPGLTFSPDFPHKDRSVELNTINSGIARDNQQFNIQAVGSDVMSQTSRPLEATGQKIKISQSGIIYTLQMIREPVVDYQETRGVPRNEEITFLTLVTSLCTQAYTAAITILVMLWNLMPLVDGLVYFVRFLLDKLIDIMQTDDNKERAIKAAILFGELAIIIFIIFMIMGLIFMPVYVLMARLFGKIFSMIAW